MYLIRFFGALLFAKIPTWSLWYLIPAHRPRPTWSIKRAVIVRTIKELFTLKVKLGDGSRSPYREVPDSELKDAKFVWVEGIPDELFVGEIRHLADTTGPRPERRAGYWLLKNGVAYPGPQARPGEKTILHLHGGAFYVSPSSSPQLFVWHFLRHHCIVAWRTHHVLLQIGSANPSDVTANFTRGLLQHSQAINRTFAIDYRLTTSAPDPTTNPFPAALLDALAGYRYLVHDAGFAPENIIVAGDSAGGNLALALVRHLIENPTPSLPPPGRVLTASAWLDLSMSRCGPDSTAVMNAPTDIFDEAPGRLFGKYGVMGLLGPLDFGVAQTNRYLSPVSLMCEPLPERRLFAGFPETYVVAGGAERLLDDSTALVRLMRADGVNVIEDVPADAVHDFLVFRWHEPERTEVLKRISGWIDGM